MTFLSSLRERLASAKAPPPPPPREDVEAKKPAYIEKRLQEQRTEQQRILDLPVITYEGARISHEFRRHDLDHLCKECASGSQFTLRPVQEEMLSALRDVNGLMAFVNTGAGKSVTAVLMGKALPDIDRVIVIAPSSTLNTLRSARLHMRLHYHMLEDIQFHSYESIQRATPEGQLDYVESIILDRGGDPARTLLIFDEAHALRNLTSARGARVMRCVQKYPQLRIAMLSGSFTDNSIKECAHMAWMCLRAGAPFPNPWGRETEHDHKPALEVLSQWAQVLDKGGQPGNDDWRSIAPLWSWAYPEAALVSYIGAERIQLIRQAFQHRLRTCPGVVMSLETSLKEVPLNLRGVRIPVPPEVETAIGQADATGEDPDGNIIPDKKAAWRVKRQLAQGFYYVWDWPVDLMTGKPIRDEAWLLARSTWNKFVRNEIAYKGKTGYDSALLVYTSVQRQIKGLAQTDLQRAWVDFVGRTHKDESPGVVARREREALKKWLAAGGSDEAFQQCDEYFLRIVGPSGLHRAWLEWSSWHKHQPKPPTKAVWISPFLMDFVTQWAKDMERQGHKVILWYDFAEVGAELGRRGFPVYGAGTEPPKKAETCALSLNTHKEGKNLQAWSKQLVLCPSPSGKTWEQSLARTHRPGQKAAEVDCWVMQHVEEFIDALNSAREAADYAQPITGNAQKLLFANYIDIKVRKTAADRFGSGIEDEDEED